MRTYPRTVVVGGLLVAVTAVSFAAILARFAMGADPGVLTASASGFAPALAVAFWRSAGGAVALAPFALRAHRRHGGLSRQRHRQLAVSGIALGLHFGLWLGSLALTTVASSVTLVTMSPLFVALASRWLFGERLRTRTWVGMALTVVGAVVIGVADATGVSFGPRALLGDVMAFGGALLVGVYLLLGRITRRDVPAATYSAVVYAWAAAVLLVACLALDVALVGFSPLTWLAIAGVVVGPQLLGHTVFNTLLSTVSATVVAIVVVTEPLGSGVLAWLLLDELPAALFYAGAPLVLAGVALATTRSRHRAEADELAEIG